MTRTIIVGDVHGCLDELRRLIDTVGLGPGDRLISVGDLVGKGPDGAGVVRFFREGGHEAVRGNHDDKLLSHRRGEHRGSLPPSHQDHARGLSTEDWAWLEALPLSLALAEHGAIVVHGGLVPGVALDAQPPAMMMNLRSIRPDGTPSRRVDEGEPWAKRWDGPELVVFGHDAIRGLQCWPHAIGLDTGCVYGLELSALVLPQRQIVSVAAARDYASAAPAKPEQKP